ncbi:MAG: hypothetical protein BWZ09_01513 [Alphaproteobacteria bacterium ADurb.BinA305]|nr:MAG: hypothetical protein BWZ09_01513 [Alphaproteobacteria bacterium ADurb.BinA305]
MSPIFLRAWYQMSGMSRARVESFATKKTIASPGLE